MLDPPQPLSLLLGWGHPATTRAAGEHATQTLFRAVQGFLRASVGAYRDIARGAFATRTVSTLRYPEDLHDPAAARAIE